MKKIVLLTVLVMCASLFAETANAQPYKQVGGEKNLQVLFTPLGNTPFSIDGISFRKFNATGTAAWRLNFTIAMSSSTSILEQAGDTVQHPTSEYDAGFNYLTSGLNPEAQSKTSSTTFSLRPGYEKHFPGTERLSPYIGIEGLWAHKSAKVERDEIDHADYSVAVATAPDTVSAPWTNYTLTREGDGGYSQFGINLIAGTDFYFAKNLHLGAEIIFGWSSKSYSDISDEYLKTNVTDLTTVPPPTTVSVTHVVTSVNDAKQGSDSGFGPDVVAQIKLGWLF